MNVSSLGASSVATAWGNSTRSTQRNTRTRWSMSPPLATSNVRAWSKSAAEGGGEGQKTTVWSRKQHTNSFSVNSFLRAFKPHNFQKPQLGVGKEPCKPFQIPARVCYLNLPHRRRRKQQRVEGNGLKATSTWSAPPRACSRNTPARQRGLEGWTRYGSPWSGFGSGGTLVRVKPLF